jgi:hypothetical protein
LLQGKGAVPAEKSLVARRIAHHRATSAALGSPRGQGKGRARDTRSRSGPAMWKASDPVHDGRTSESDPGPFRVGSGQITTGSRDSGAGNTRTLPWKGSGAGTRPGLALGSPLRRRPAAAAWLVAHDIRQPAEPGVGPLKPHSLGIYCREDVSPATKPTSDVPSRHLMRPVLSAGRRRQSSDGAPAQSIIKQCACAMRRTMLIIPSTRSFPCTPRIRRSRASRHKKIAPAANICNPKCYILYVPGPTCRGPVPLYMPPSAIKGEACDVTNRPNLRLTQTLTSSRSIHHTVE